MVAGADASMPGEPLQQNLYTARERNHLIETCSACSNSNEQLSIDLPGMKIKKTTQRNSWKGQPYLT